MLLSVIVPVYNVEKYVDRCINSLLAQEVNKEIIIVDDGSTDSSSVIVDRYLSKDCKVIHQRNRGLSAARNRGLEEATGDYILFVDSDDYILDGSLKKILAVIEENRYDIYVGYAEAEIQMENKVCIKNKINYNLPIQLYDGADYLQTVLKQKQCTLCAQYNFYSSVFIRKNSLAFIEGKLHEDELWTPTCFLKAETIYNTGEFFYRHCEREGSITHGKSKIKNALDLISICGYLEKLIISSDGRTLKYLEDRMAMLYMHAVHLFSMEKNLKELRFSRFFPVKYAKKIKNRVKSLLFLCSPYLYCRINGLSKGKR